MLPLDVGNRGNSDRILTWLKDAGYEIQSDFAMGLSVDQIKNCPDADLNLVVARSGLAAARFLEKKYGIPYICGLPLGDGAELKDRLEKQERFQPLPEGNSDKKGILIIHEQIFANAASGPSLQRDRRSHHRGKPFRPGSRIESSAGCSPS